MKNLHCCQISLLDNCLFFLQQEIDNTLQLINWLAVVKLRRSALERYSATSVFSRATLRHLIFYWSSVPTGKFRASLVTDGQKSKDAFMMWVGRRQW